MSPVLALAFSDGSENWHDVAMYSVD